MIQSTLLRVLGSLLVMTVAFGLSACGNDDPTVPAGTAGAPDVSEDENVALYCQLTEALDKAGSAFFKKLEADDNATNKDYEKAEADFFRKYSDELDELIEAAPAEIGADVATIIASIRSRAGLGPKVSQKDASASEKVVQGFEKENC